jgi:hypothetical protein
VGKLTFNCGNRRPPTHAELVDHSWKAHWRVECRLSISQRRRIQKILRGFRAGCFLHYRLTGLTSMDQTLDYVFKRSDRAASSEKNFVDSPPIPVKELQAPLPLSFSPGNKQRKCSAPKIETDLQIGWRQTPPF